MRRGIWPALGYAAVFVGLGLPWLRTSADSVPAGNPFAFADDARLWVWLLGWVAHAMATDPGGVLDANIHHPAPAQLTGSEHLASTQLVAVPAVWATGSPVLVANLLVFLSYPLAALALQRLVLACGAGAAAAFAGGLVFALGPLRAPANLEVIHFLNLYLPLGALALHRLRDRPTAGRAAVLCAVLGAGMLSGYYLTVMLALALAPWTAFETLRAQPARGRFLALAAAAAAVATALLLVVSLPYFARPELAVGARVGGLRPVDAGLGWAAVGTLLRLMVGVVPGVLAVLGVGALASRAAPARRLAALGLVLALVGLAGVFPPAALVQAIEASPLRFLRAQFRFGVVTGFGTALLGVAALEAVRARFGARAGTGAAALAVAALLATFGPTFAGRRDPIAAVGADRPVYDTVAEVAAREGRGPLLELPLVDAHWTRRGSALPLGQLESEAMVGSLRHWLPLVSGHTGYEPLHRPVLETAIRALPAPSALDDLVDLTRVRWLLLRPVGYWSDARLRERVLAMPGVARVVERNGWVLARVDRPVRRPQWYDAIAAGYRPGATVLGTPLVPLAADQAIGTIAPLPTMFPRLDAGARWMLLVTIANVGPAPWPVTVPPALPPTHTVRLEARWTRDGAEVARQTLPLARDVPAGDVLEQTLVLDVPAVPGEYDLEVGLVQVDGARFEAEGNRRLRLRLAVVPRRVPAPPGA